METDLRHFGHTGTDIQTGGIPQKFSGGKEPTVVIPGVPKEVREFDGKKYLMEKALKGDVAILRAWKVDKAGNCVFRFVWHSVSREIDIDLTTVIHCRYTTRAFGGLVARAARLTIVEAEQIVEIGELGPMEIDLPGIYVDRIVPATVDKQIEFMTLREENPSPTPSSTSSAVASEEDTSAKDAARIKREKIARRAAKELNDGDYCNLGVGIPVLAANFLKEGTNVWLQSENGILGEFLAHPTRFPPPPRLALNMLFLGCACNRDGTLSHERGGRRVCYSSEHLPAVPKLTIVFSNFQ